MIIVHTFTPSGYFGSNCFVIESDGLYAVVDPSVSVEVVKERLKNLSNVRYILLTHCHFDHIYSINSWVTTFPNAEVIIGTGDAAGLSDSSINCYLGFLGVDDGYYGRYTPVTDRQTLSFGDKVIRVISSPGHTIGGVCYRLENHLFVGDTLFEGGGYGRFDLPGGNFAALERSILRIISQEADGRVYCGHGLNTTLQDVMARFKA